VKALTVRNPYAHAIARWHDTIINMTWPTAYRGELAIHAHPTAFDDAAADDHRIAGAAAAYPAVPYVAGAVVAVGHLAGCHHADRCDHAWTPCCYPSCNHLCDPWATYGMWHWQLTGVRTLAVPVRCGAGLGLWELPDAVARQTDDPTMDLF
jgi:hypothetical protein